VVNPSVYPSIFLGIILLAVNIGPYNGSRIGKKKIDEIYAIGSDLNP
jgi:hypothetical protein